MDVFWPPVRPVIVREDQIAAVPAGQPRTAGTAIGDACANLCWDHVTSAAYLSALPQSARRPPFSARACVGTAARKASEQRRISLGIATNGPKATPARARGGSTPKGLQVVVAVSDQRHNRQTEHQT